MAVYEIKPSRWLRAMLIALHALAAVALFLAELGAGWQAGGAAVLVVSVYLVLRARPVVRLQCDDKGGLRIEAGGAWQEISLQAGTVVMPMLCVLRLRREGEGTPFGVVILPNCLPAEEFRRLRVWLRWKGKLLQ